MNRRCDIGVLPVGKHSIDPDTVFGLLGDFKVSSQSRLVRGSRSGSP